MKKKSQASMELFFIIGTLIFLFAIICWASIERNSESKDTKSFLDKRDLCLKVADGINSVYSANDGAVTKIDNIKYGINITPNYRTIEVYDLNNRRDFITCPVPVEKIIYYNPEAGYNGSVEKYQETLKGFGSPVYSFEINSRTIQMRNIENRVFICTTCNLNELDYAEGMTTKSISNPVTNPIKRLDGDVLTIISAGEGTLPGEYLFNVAYIKLGSPYCLQTILEELGYIGSKACTEYSDPNCNAQKGACNIFKATSIVKKCLFNPGKPDFTNHYTLFLYEDVQNLDSTQLAVFQNRVSRAGWAFLSGGILDGSQGYIMGAYVYDDYSAGVAQHVGDDSEGFFELTDPTVDFTGKHGAVKNPDNMVDFEPLYNFVSNPSYNAIARWRYPDQEALHGDIYYFTDYCTVKSAINKTIKKILNIEYYSWVRAEFKLGKQIGGTVPAQNPINIYVAHEITDQNYDGKTAWVSEIDWCNLETGCSSWNAIGIAEDGSGICENHISEYNNNKIARCTINLGNPKIENIGLKIKFSAPSGSGRVPIDVDFIQVETCY